MTLRIDAVDPAFDTLVSGNAVAHRVFTGITFGEGPVWNAREGCLYWVEIVGDTIWKWTPGLGSEIVMRPSGHADGMTLDPEGRLVVAGWASRTVWRREHDGSITTVATGYDGKKFNTPNDIVVRSDGAIYFTDPPGALFNVGMSGAGDDVQRYMDYQGVFRIAPGTHEVSLVAEDFEHPNGLCFSPDESVLYINDSKFATIRAFEVRPDGSLEGGEVIHQTQGLLPGNPDGMKCDVLGNIWVSAPGGIHVVDPGGKLIGRLRYDEQIINFTFGGTDLETLYAVGLKSVWSVETKVAGIPIGLPAEVDGSKEASR